MQIVYKHKVCTSSFLTMFGLSRDFWSHVTKVATIGLMPSLHGNCGKKRAIDPDNHTTTVLHSHFEALLGMAEVRATRFVSDTVDGISQRTVTQDNDNGNVYLPSNDGTCPSYYRYCLAQGYKVQTTATGNIVKEWVGFDGYEDGATKPSIVSLGTYHRFWKTNYPNLKVSPLCEDICPECQKYANRKKYCLTTSNLIHFSRDNLKPRPEDTGCEDDEDESRQASTGADLTDEQDDCPFFIPPGGESPYEVDEENECMLLCAAYHLFMARAQRALYRTVVSNAISDAKVKKPHSEKTFTFVVDYGQNMQLPVFNQEQPGTTYYYSPVNIYNLGVVDHAYVGNGDHKNPQEHIPSHVYHEGIGKKGANNVCSLLMKTLTDNGVLNECVCGGKLNVVFDNCSGQNKNNTVLSWYHTLLKWDTSRRSISSFWLLSTARMQLIGFSMLSRKSIVTKTFMS